MSDTPISNQPPPHAADDSARVLDCVLEDLIKRARFGYTKYGSYVRTRNGRDPLQDAYEEVLDTAMYLKQAIMEREGL